MEKDKVQEYISKLMELNSKIEDVDDESLEDDEMLNDNFIQTLNNVLTSLNKDVEQEMMRGVMETPQQVSLSRKHRVWIVYHITWVKEELKSLFYLTHR